MFLSRQFVAFVISGGIAAACNFGSRIFFDIYLSFSTSIILAYVIGMITAYSLNRFFVFSQTTRSHSSSIFYFVLVNVFAVLQTWCISLVLAYYFLPYFSVELYVFEISHFFGVIVPVFTSFIGHKYLTFGNPKEKSRVQMS